MYQDLRTMIIQNQADTKGHADELGSLKRQCDKLGERVGDAETAIEFLKKLGAPSGGDGGAGLLDALNDMTEKLRKEFNDKLDNLNNDLTKSMDGTRDDLLARLQKLEEETKAVDDDEQKQIDELKLLQNGTSDKLEALEEAVNKLKVNKCEQDDFDKEIFDIKEMIANLGAGKPVAVRAASPKDKGPKITQADVDRWNEAAKKTDKNEGLLDKLAKQLEDLDKIRNRLHDLEKKCSDFVTQDEHAKVVNDLRGVHSYIETNRELVQTIRTDLDRLKKMVDKMDGPSMSEFKLLVSRVDALEN